MNRKMDENEFLGIVDAWLDYSPEELAGETPREYNARDSRYLADRLGIELTTREEEMEMVPCPWCGTVSELSVVPGGWVCCHACNVEGPGEYGNTRSQAIAAWNRRTPTPKLPTWEEVAEAARCAYVEGKEWSKRWRNVADAAFRAFGLTPPSSRGGGPMTAIDLRFLSACPHAEPMGHNAESEGGCEPVECHLCGWTGHVCELLDCGDTEGDCTENLWTPCCRTVHWAFA